MLTSIPRPLTSSPKARPACEASDHDAEAGGFSPPSGDQVEVNDDRTRQAPVLRPEAAYDDPMPSEPITVNRANAFPRAHFESRSASVGALAANLTRLRANAESLSSLRPFRSSRAGLVRGNLDSWPEMRSSKRPTLTAYLSAADGSPITGAARMATTTK